MTGKMEMNFASEDSLSGRFKHYGLRLPGILVLFFGLTLSANSQMPSMRVRYFSKADGITNSYINNVAQDSTGFIWVATHDGLFKYDGYTFTGYYSNRADDHSISGNEINSMYYDSRGRLWLGTNNGICFYNEKSDNFTRISDFQPLTDNQVISCINEDKNGNIFISVYHAILRYNEKTEKFNQVVFINSREINWFQFDSADNLWVGCSENAGLFRCQLNKNPDEIQLQPGSSNNVIKNVNVSGFAIDGDSIWVATFGQGIKMLDTKSGKIVQYPYNNSSEAKVLRMYVDKNNNIWSVDFSGLKFLRKRSGRFFGYYPRQNDPFSIRGSVKGIFQDKQGNYWVYNDPGGVGIDMLLKGFTNFDNNPQDYWHTTDISIVAIEEDRYGNLWLGNSTNGVDIFNWQTGKTIRYFYNSKDKYSLGQGATLCLFRDSSGTMWIGTYQGGLQYFDDKTRKFISYMHNDGNPNTIAGNDVRSIAEDDDGNLWLAIHGKGVDKFEPGRKRFTHYTKSQNRLINNWAYKVLFDHRGDLWVGTLKGLSRLKKGESVFESWRSEFTDTTTISNDYITTLHEDKNNTMWVGTTAGLSRYNPRKNNFTRFNDILGSDNISGILDDDKDRLWISTHSGLSMYDPQTRKVINFTSYDGLGADEYNPRASFCNSSNDFFFGGIKGVDAFNPSKLKFNTKPPRVYIDGIRVFNKSLSADSAGYKLLKNLRFVKGITLKHNENIITIYFKALNFINPGLNRYSYKLEGLDKQWHDAGTGCEATYTKLSPGRYTFKVIACNNDGIWNTSGAKLDIEVKSPWYATVFAIMVFALLLITIVVWYIGWRTGALERQSANLEKSVQEKTSELSVKNELLRKHAEHLDEANKLLVERQDQLEQQSEELKDQTENLALANAELEKLNATKDRLLSIIGHDMSTPFSAILGLTNLFETEFESLTDDKKLEYVRDINISSERLYALLQNLLLWARSQMMKISYNPSVIDLCRMVNDIFELRRGELKAKSIEHYIDCPEHLTAWADPDMTKAILRNLVSNAIKFTPQKGTVGISVKVTDHEIEISVTDTGKGITREKIAQTMSSEMVEPEWGTDGEKGSGLGLALCRDFVSMNKGRLEITGTPGMGSIFTFTLPIVEEK
jgi:signal transduction histidine kinase/ligand-binding sensor domain-containing protein